MKKTILLVIGLIMVFGLYSNVANSDTKTESTEIVSQESFFPDTIDVEEELEIEEWMMNPRQWTIKK